MKSYNGFSPEERWAAFRIVERAWAEGTLPHPAKCQACGQRDGYIMGHNEDYSQPLDYYETCYTCHMMLHCRFGAAEHWREYLELLAGGAVFPPMGGPRWEEFKAAYLVQSPGAAVIGRGSPRDVWMRHLPITRQTAPPVLPPGAQPCRAAQSRH